MTYESPEDLGLKGYPSWRPNQKEAVERITSTTSRFVALVAPTGAGKSVVYTASALLGSGRALILTATKALQDQLTRDFSESVGLVDVRGRAAYPCRLTHLPADTAPCRFKVQCVFKNSPSCAYYAAVLQAKRSALVTTNYAYWMALNNFPDNPLGDFDFLVCDEAHDLPNLVSDHLTVRFAKTDRVAEEYLGDVLKQPLEVEAWRDKAGAAQTKVGDTIERYLEMMKARSGEDHAVEWRALSRLAILHEKLVRLSELSDTWVVDASESEVSFTPIWPTHYTESLLFAGIPKVLLSSASICDKTVAMLGVGEVDSIEYPHTFPVENRLLVHIPTIRLNAKTNEMGYRQWVRRIDQIVRARLDRKGIIHTISYSRMRRVYEFSEMRDFMLIHEPGELARAIERFKQADPPLILVSPSVSTGYDFPAEQCRYQIIGKIPYPDTRDKVTALRIAHDKTYAAYLAMQELVQMTGRAVRAEDDWAENFIIDDTVVWFLPMYKDFAPKWFQEAYTRRQTIPEAPIV